MGKRQINLARILKEGGINVFHPVVEDRSLFSQSAYDNELLRIYKALGGILHEYPINFGSFDIVLQKCFIELDEENHFNRYRKVTLNSKFYSNHNFFPVQHFKDFCDKYEKKARKNGGYWSNKSSENQYGKSSPEGNFAGNGPARWKQRAFHDMLKDIYGVLIHKPVIRVSIYSVINDVSVNKILTKENSDNLLFQHILQELSGKLSNN